MKAKKYIIIFGIITILLLVCALFIGFMSAKRMENIICDDFNQQQLVLAKQIASQIEESVTSIKRALLTLSLSPSIQYLEPSWANPIGIIMPSIRNNGVFETRLIDAKGETAYLVDNKGTSYTLKGNFDNNDYFKWCSLKENKGRIYTSGVIKEYGKLVIRMAMPVYQESVDEAHPLSTHHFSGVLVFVIDTTSMVGKVAKGIKSGKTGYAWVINNKGIFLYHPEKQFIGRNAFEVRREKKPKVSFARINFIQKERMLQGKEGMSWYISGWHREMKGKIKKLIAYAPIYPDKNRSKNCCSVAVVAPVNEIQGAIRSVYVRQFYVMLSIIVAIMFLGGYIMNFESRWTQALKEEVRIKTEDLRNSTEKLKKSERKYKSLVEGAEDLIFTIDTEGNYLSMNRYAAQFFGAKFPEELIGKNMYDLFSKSSADLQMGFVRDACRTKKSVSSKYPVEIGKREYWFSSSFINIREQGGKCHILGISRDITQRKKAEEQMYQTEKLASLGKLAAGVAHEINNPIAIILGFTDILLERIEPKSKNYEILKIIERQGANCKRIVEDLMSFARIPEKAEYSTDINQALEKIISIIQNTLLTKKISLKKDLTDGLPRVRGDPGELQQVFMNLINNAIAAMDGGGTLTVSTKISDYTNRVDILFTDTGHGIKEEYRDKIFDPFFTTRKVGEGTGLGLSVSYGIINRYRGEIRFETITEEESREKHGTTFILSLPIVRETKGIGQRA